MGTNFYLKKLPTAKEHQEMQELLMQKQYEALQELLHTSTTRYHIGKRSGGWQFLFAPHSSFYDGDLNPWFNTLDSLKETLANPDYVIEDEYGKRYSPDEFWKEIEPCLYRDKNHINGEDYDKLERKLLSKETTMSEFTTDEGLRFSKFIDFC